MNPKYISDFQAAGLKFVGHDTDGQRMEIAELEGKSFFLDAFSVLLTTVMD